MEINDVDGETIWTDDSENNQGCGEGNSDENQYKNIKANMKYFLAKYYFTQANIMKTLIYI